MPGLPTVIAGASLCAGEAYLADTPGLRGHVGTQPDLFLRWKAIPRVAETVDVVVHLHGFSQQGRDMPLAEKAPRSGIDLSGRERPTVALLPRGNWIQHYYYDFPGLLSGGIDALIAYALDRIARAAGFRRLAADRLILSAHSGGVMPALDILAEARRAPDELYLFDGLYGRDPRLGEKGRDLAVIEGWVAARLAAEAERPGALRVVYVERETGPMSRDLAAIIAKQLAAADPALATGLARRYRVERSGVPHAYVAAICLPQLLAQSGVEFDWSRV